MTYVVVIAPVVWSGVPNGVRIMTTPYRPSLRPLILSLFAFGALFAMSNTVPASPADLPGALPSDAEGFYFLEGRWRIDHRMLKDPKGEDWVEFKGQARFFTLLDGLVSVEELRDAEGKPFGGAMRTFDRDKRTWSDSWVSARFGVLQEAQHGSFVDGLGSFVSPDELDGKPILARGLWKRVSKDVVTWEQAISFDDGKSWKTTWFMRFERIAQVSDAAHYGERLVGAQCGETLAPALA